MLWVKKMISQLSKYFNRLEFACNCKCGFDTVDISLHSGLVLVRDFCGGPLHITSGCRCKSYNKLVDGEEESQHLYGRAADIWSLFKKVHEIYQFIDVELDWQGGLIMYKTFVHMDSRNDGKYRSDRRV